jgi:hypothetical protein
MTQHYTSDGWRDDRLDAMQNLGRNAHNFAALDKRKIRMGQREQRKWLALLAAAWIAGLAIGYTTESIWTEWNRVAVEAGE